MYGYANTILHNGKIITVDRQDTVAQAVAIQGNRILAVGSDDEVKGLAGPDTRLIDLRGSAVIPGIVDIHAHLDREGLEIDFSFPGRTALHYRDSRADRRVGSR